MIGSAGFAGLFDGFCFSPCVIRYFMMLGMGVPKESLKQKMRAEGVDPNIIEYEAFLACLSTC